jgi:RNA polymerase sigma factor (sigma-70 family)
MPGKPTHFTVSLKDLTAAPPSERVLEFVSAALDGDESAKADFYNVFRPLVERWIAKWNAKSGSVKRPDADDDCQDVLVRLIYGDRRAAAVDFTSHQSPLRQWLNYVGPTRRSLYKFVQYNANFYFRDLRRSARPQALDNPVGLEDLVEAEPGLTLEERSQLRRCSRTCWRKMNPSHREVLENVGIEGRTQSETADKLGVSEATVSRWLRDASKNFRACLEENCPEYLLPF